MKNVHIAKNQKKIDAKSLVFTVVFIIAALSAAFAANTFDVLEEFKETWYTVLVLLVVILSCITKGYVYSMVFASVSSAVMIYILFERDMHFIGLAVRLSPILIGFFIISFVTCKMKELIIEQEKVNLEIEKEKIRANLLRAISHDLRTPLTAISGTSETIIREIDSLDRETVKNFCRSIQSDSQWLIRMVENILSITKISDGSSRITKTPEIAEEIIMSAAAKFRRRFDSPEVKIKIPEELITVPMDAILIEQVITNLLENTVKHAKTATLVTVSLSSDGKNAVFEVADNGEGIPADRLNGIFEGTLKQVDLKTSDSTKNMGIGLSVCSTVVKAHGGTITAGNSKTGGAVFTLTLPLEKEETDDEQ